MQESTRLIRIVQSMSYVIARLRLIQPMGSLIQNHVNNYGRVALRGLNE